VSAGELERRSVAELEEDRAFAHLMRTANLYARIPGLRKELQDKPEAVAGIMLSLQAYGLAVTLPGLNLFDWIEGQAVPSGQLYQGLAHMAGYQLIPVARTAERAVARIVGPDGSSIEVEFNLADAKAAHRLDEWVENWSQTTTGKNFKTTWILRVNGVATEGDAPAWALEEERKGKVKRFDAWWNYRTDMLWKSAARRAIRIACPHVLIGGGTDVAHVPPVRHEQALGALGYQRPVVDVDAVRVPPEVHDAEPEASAHDPANLFDEGRPFE
jgi:hypothetical protein